MTTRIKFLYFWYVIYVCSSSTYQPHSLSLHLRCLASLLASHCLWSLFSVLSDFDSRDERDQEKNNQLAFDVAEREFGISPCMTGKEMSSVVEPDKLSMVMYLSQFYEMFKDTVPPGGERWCYSGSFYSVIFFWETSWRSLIRRVIYSKKSIILKEL